MNELIAFKSSTKSSTIENLPYRVVELLVTIIDLYVLYQL
jgi:hypothetical protein